ncbi:MAG: di-heme oxidoredictase family protein, partial [Burkholderiales bacterium]
MRAASAWGTAAIVLSALAASAAVDEIPPEALSAGSFTVALTDRTAFSEPAPVLDYRQREKFLRGRQHFNQKWVVFPSLGGDWGLGPTFIADRCSACHVGAGRGDAPKSADQQLLSVLVRISVPGEDEHGGPKPHPNYGDQLQNQGLMGQDRDATYLGERVPPEAELYLDWQELPVAFADGEKVTLRKPRLRVEKLNFGPIGPEVMYSLRIAQPIFGLGLLEAVSEADILQIAERQKSQGVSGRPNHVWDAINKRVAVGRFGWKSNQPSIRQQIAAAFHGDIGVTSPLFDKENCPPVQQDCAYQPPGNQPELIELNWD